MTVFSYCTTPTLFQRLSSVLCKFYHNKLISFGCHPRDGVTRGCPPSPSDATGAWPPNLLFCGGNSRAAER